MTTEVIARSQAGDIVKIPNLKKRQRSTYYRPDGKGGWLPTRPLPSDANGRELYQSKGFRLSIPSETVTPEQVADTEKEDLLAENKRLRDQLAMSKAREARGKKPDQGGSLSGTP